MEHFVNTRNLAERPVPLRNAMSVAKLMTMKLVDLLSKVQAGKVNSGKCYIQSRNRDILFVE